MSRILYITGTIFILLISPLFILAQVFTAWYFEGSALPSKGTGSIVTVGGTSTTFNSSFNVSGGTALSNTNFPAQGTNAGTAGLEIAASTAGKAGISISWIQRHSGSSSRYLRLLISTNGVDFTPFDLSTNNATATLLTAGQSNASNINATDDVFEGIGEDTWHRRTVNLSAITTVDNNPNFTFRLVSVFEPNTTAYTATGIGRTYATTGNYRYDSLEITAATTLPLNFVSFHAQETTGGIQLKWKTALEKDVQRFTIQHGTDGQHFNEIGHQSASNAASGSYSFMHTKVAEGINLYRVVAIDKDGSRHISPVISASVSAYDNKVSYLFPTYVQNQATIVIHSEKECKEVIKIFNNNGRLVLSQPVLLRNGANYQILQLSFLPAGVYYLQHPYRKGTKTITFVKN